jgi:hypothetical protein
MPPGVLPRKATTAAEQCGVHSRPAATHHRSASAQRGSRHGKSTGGTMSAPQGLLSDFDEEIASTRRFLERVPEVRLTWRPHPASATLGELASHIAELPAWTRAALKQDTRDYPAEDGGGREPIRFDSVPNILSFFDRNCADGGGSSRTQTTRSLPGPGVSQRAMAPCSPGPRQPCSGGWCFGISYIIGVS